MCWCAYVNAIKGGGTYIYMCVCVCVCVYGSAGIESACNTGEAGDTGSVSESRRSPGGGHGNPLQYPCLESPMDRGVWWAKVHGIAKSLK